MIKSIYKKEGLIGFYRGYSATMLAYPIFHGLFFSIYNYLKPKFKNYFNTN